MGWQLSFPAQLSHYVSQAVAMSAETTAPLSPSRFMASKRYRWTALAALLTIFFVFFLVKNHDALPQRLPQGIPSTYTYTGGDVDWSRFAYTQYVTNSEYLCNSVMFFESLHRLSSKADRVMMFPSRMLKSEDDESSDARLLIKARDKYNVKLVPITIQHRDNADSTWADSFTKLLAFNQTQYSRVLSIDSDSMLLQPMDELFLLPSVPVAMPRAYWLWPDKEILSSQVVLIEPSDAEFKRIQDKIEAASGDDYDMEIVNYLYRDSALVLPHRRYDLLTGEFRGENHSKYLGSDVEVWDPATAYSEAKLVHFSDWPLPKPWLPTPEDIRIKIQPDCKNTTEGLEDCTARIIWNSFYTDFKTKREEVCGDGDGDAKPSQAAR